MDSLVAEAVELYRDAIRRNRSATCESCGHQGASQRVLETQANLYNVIRAEVEHEAEASNIGTEV
jgi:hypothetical protein